MDASAISTAKQYLRMKYLVTAATATALPVYDLRGLRKLADEIALSAFDAVTLTGQAFEGGSHQGQLTFPRMDYLQAVMDIIAEANPTGTPQAPTRTTFADFSGGQSQV